MMCMVLYDIRKGGFLSLYADKKSSSPSAFLSLCVCLFVSYLLLSHVTAHILESDRFGRELRVDMQANHPGLSRLRLRRVLEVNTGGISGSGSRRSRRGREDTSAKSISEE